MISIEDFALKKENSSELRYLCTYLYLDILSQDNNIEINKIVENIVIDRYNYFKFNSFFKRVILKISPKLFIKKFLVKER
ncbi:hypothetical protein KMP11_02300 [Gemella sp. zg-570]|uniref:hypothetical protein n=1 Tax=Gemella sp. zg-570 TaxID=2840371 RepID=UPI001C0D8C1C|nr:hypothetical protein [Gemella sp. zg-570]QWQ39180.1 hypothetical protein KMP11_02300 [Gemella sp. zg-570]